MRRPKDKRLYWRGSKLWCRVPGPGGRIVRTATRCTDETAASARADELERRYADPSYAAASAANLEGSVRALVADMRRRGRSDATITIARQKLGHFVRVWGASLTMSELATRGPEMVTSYIDRRLEEGAARFTVAKELAHLKMALAIARYLATFPRDPATMFPPFFSGGHTPRTRKPTPAEVERVLLELDGYRAAHLAFIVGTGARRGEAARARRSDVDLAAGVVHIRGTKTAAADDDVPITVISRPWIERAIAWAPGDPARLPTSSSDDDMPIRPRQPPPMFAAWGNLSRDLAAACERAGVERITPNDLRRAFGSWHRDAGVSAEHVSKLLRHTTDKLAQTTYAKLQAPALGEIVGRSLAGVSVTYAPSGQDGPNSVPVAGPNSENAWESRATLGNRTRDLRFTKPDASERSRRIKQGMSRAAEARGVPNLYARRPPWLYEATANLYELLASRAP